MVDPDGVRPCPARHGADSTRSLLGFRGYRRENFDRGTEFIDTFQFEIFRRCVGNRPNMDRDMALVLGFGDFFTFSIVEIVGDTILDFDCDSSDIIVAGGIHGNGNGMDEALLCLLSHLA